MIKKIFVIIITILFQNLEQIFPQELNDSNYPAKFNRDVLPVELVYFFLADVDSGVILFFGTATEVENYGFDVQRAYSDLIFESIGFVDGNGNSNSPKNYNYLDSTVTKSGTIYYRLKQIDFNGTSEFSDTISIDFLTSINFESSEIPETFYVSNNFPNPFNPTTKLNFELPFLQILKINLFDIRGKLVKEIASQEFLPGIYQLSLDFSSYSSGIYFVRFETVNFCVTKRIVYLK